MKIENYFVKAVRPPDGRLMGYTELDTDEKIPAFLSEPARGKFGKIEEEIAAIYGVPIPHSWNVANVCALLAVGYALLTDSDDVNFDPHKSRSEVTLVVDPYNQNSIQYWVTLNSNKYKGRFYIPGLQGSADSSTSDAEELIGMPIYMLKKGWGIMGIMPDARILQFRESEKTPPLRERFIDFVASQMRQ